jgi:uncharacterized RDD family membrane protein YckC
MKCPKCGYLGFEHVERCRNCGYEFFLSEAAAPLPDLAIRHDSPAFTPLDDLTLSEPSPRAGRGRFLDEVDADLDRIIGAPAAPAAPPRPPAPASAVGEPSLFGPPLTGDVPLITKASPPRTPLAVRRATPDTPRLRAESVRTASLDLPLDLDLPDTGGRLALSPPERVSIEPAARLDPQQADAAGVFARMAAAAIDAIILAVVDIVVVYFTLQICGVGLADLSVVPKVPLLAFLLVQNGGYLVVFTAGGQTLGKMAAGIKVVPAEPDDALDLGRAFLRTLVWLVLAVPAGLGFLSAIFSRDHRGLHDRFAGTRVVRASA